MLIRFQDFSHWTQFESIGKGKAIIESLETYQLNKIPNDVYDQSNLRREDS